MERLCDEMWVSPSGEIELKCEIQQEDSKVFKIFTSTARGLYAKLQMTVK